ncbi:MAG: hypothetical protein JEZ02_06780 [Desulfatibacillum sp.]|nr:hypothetical protein [Desulfatibacillum sp.]
MKCPVCQCQRFYVKDPEDEFEVYCFDCQTGEPVFDQKVSDQCDLEDDTDVHCDRCSWHGTLDTLK